MKKALMLLSVAAGLVSGSALADAGYGTAGCGLGSIVFGNKAGIIQIFAATTNGTFASQTFGITSGTSNCQDAVMTKAGTKVYIETNREALAKEIARGKGESIRNLAAIAGCSDSKAVGSKLKKNFKKIFPSQTASDTEVSDAILTTLSSEDLACGNVSL
jgi:hypothetical protein